MTRLGLYLMNKRGLTALEALVSRVGPESVSYAVVASDANVANDYVADIRELCEEHGIDCRRRADGPFDDLSEDVKIAIGWKWLIEPSSNLLVLHDSPLPAYRGFAPLVNMLVNGEPELAVTAIEAVAAYDEGDILLQKRVPITYPMKAVDAIDAVSELYGEVLVELYRELTEGRTTKTPQDHSQATVSPWLDEEDYYVDWTWPVDKIERFVNAVGFPFLGARTRLNGQDLWIDEISQCVDVVVEDRPRHIGKVIRLEDGHPVVVCGQGLARIDALRGEDDAHPKVPFRSRFS